MSREVLVRRRQDFDGGARKIMTVGDREVGVLQHDGRFYAYENRCVHRGGPVCERRDLGRVAVVPGEDKTVLGERFSANQTVVLRQAHSASRP